MATSPASSANSGGSIPSSGIHSIMNRKATLQNQQKEFVTCVHNLLVFESGTCILSCKLCNEKMRETQMKEVFETNCQTLDLDHPRIIGHCKHLYRRITFENLLKESVLYTMFPGEILSGGGTLWNSFVNQRSEFQNQWMPNYKLTSGDTASGDEAAMVRMVPHLWLLKKTEVFCGCYSLKQVARQRQHASLKLDY
jgi:hypothetical protein